MKISTQSEERLDFLFTPEAGSMIPHWMIGGEMFQVAKAFLTATSGFAAEVNVLERYNILYNIRPNPNLALE